MAAQIKESEKGKAKESTSSASTTINTETTNQKVADKKEVIDAAANKKRELAERFVGAIQYHLKDIYEETLNDGVDVNYSDDDIPAALNEAIASYNIWARKDLLQKRGANPRGVSKTNQRVPIQIAVAIGDFEAFEELVDEYHIDPRVFREMNLLNIALEEITDYTLLQNAHFCKNANAVGNAQKDVNLKKEIESFFYQTGEYEQVDGESIPFKQKDSIHAFYSGQQDMIASLLSRGVNPTLAATGTDRSPHLIAKNPKKYLYAFRGGEGTLKFLADEGQNVLIFKMNFRNKTREQGFEIFIHYDLKPTEKLIEAHLPNVALENVKNEEFTKARRYSDQFRQLREEQNLVKNQITSVERKQILDANLAEERNKVVDKKLGVKAEKAIEEFCKHPGLERFFDILSRKLFIKLDAYQQLSSGSIPRIKDTKGDYGTSILDFVKEHIPAPFNLPFTAFSKLTKNKVDAKEKSRYEKIAFLLPNEKDLKVYCRELVAEVTTGLIRFINVMSPGTIEKMISGEPQQLKEMEDLAKRAFVVAIYHIYNVDELHIDTKLSAEDRSNALTQKILHSIANSEFFRELVEGKIKTASARISPPGTPNPQTKPAIPPRPMLAQFDMVKAAADAHEKEESQNKSGLLAGVSKLRTKAKNAYVESAYS